MSEVLDKVKIVDEPAGQGRFRLGITLMTLAIVSCVAFQSGYEIDAQTDTVHIRDKSLAPVQLIAVKGESVHLTIVNEGKQVHNFVIPDFYIFTQNMQPGERVQVGFTPDKTGAFPFYSDTGGEPEPGISGTLRVRASSGNP